MENLAQQINYSILIILESTDELEEAVNHIDCHAVLAGETCLVSICRQTNFDNECIVLL